MQVHKRTKNSTCFYQKTEEYTKPQDLSVAKKLMEGSSVWFCVLYNNTGNVILIVKSFFCDLRLYNIFTTSIRERHISILSTRNVIWALGGWWGVLAPVTFLGENHAHEYIRDKNTTFKKMSSGFN